MEATLAEVEKFWDENPLFTGEASYDEHFFNHHTRTYFSEVFFGISPERWFAFPENKAAGILDLGCGIGFWCEYLLSLGYENITGADISSRSLELASARVKANPHVRFKQENAEKLSFSNEQFDHVNCQGVVHHTPHTQLAINEIARVTKEGGTASISVYYNNWLVRLYPMLRSIFSGLFRFFGTETGRGRNFAAPKNREELVRLYDGIHNPVGKSYTRREFVAMCKGAGFSQVEIKYFFFPFRFLSLHFPRPMKWLLLKFFPFMIVANCQK